MKLKKQKKKRKKIQFNTHQWLKNKQTLFPENWRIYSQFDNENLHLTLCVILVAKSCLTLAPPQTVASQVPLSMRFFFQFYLFIFFTILYWFWHILTWICHGCTRVAHPEPLSHLPSHSITLGHPSAPAPSTLYHASNLSMRFFRQEYWSGLPFSSQGDLPDWEMEIPVSCIAGRFFLTELPGKPISNIVPNIWKCMCL